MYAVYGEVYQWSLDFGEEVMNLNEVVFVRFLCSLFVFLPLFLFLYCCWILVLATSFDDL